MSPPSYPNQIMVGVGLFILGALGCNGGSSRPASNDAPALLGVCIGVNEFFFANRQYKNLSYAVNDAEYFAGLIASEQFHGEKGFSSREVHLLLDRGANRTDVRLMLSDRLATLKKGDWLVVYISTHGVLASDGSKSSYLLCHDSISDRVDEMEYLRGTSLETSFLVAQLATYGAKAGQILVFVDACRAGSTIHGSLVNLLKPEIEAGRMPPITVLTASTNDLALGDGINTIDGRGHGSFTHYMIQGIRTRAADANRNGTISAQELFNFAKTGLAGTQVPALLSHRDVALINPTASHAPVGSIHRYQEPSTIKIKPSNDDRARAEPQALHYLLHRPDLLHFPYFRTYSNVLDWSKVRESAALLEKALERNSSWKIDPESMGRYLLIAANLEYLIRGDNQPNHARIAKALQLYEQAEEFLMSQKDEGSRRLLAYAMLRIALCTYMRWSRYSLPQTNPDSIQASLEKLRLTSVLVETFTEDREKQILLSGVIAGTIACIQELGTLYEEQGNEPQKLKYYSMYDEIVASIPEADWLSLNLKMLRLSRKLVRNRDKLDPDPALTELKTFTAAVKNETTLESPDYAFNHGTALLAIGSRQADLMKWQDASATLEEGKRELLRIKSHPGLLFLRSRWHPPIQLAELEACLYQVYLALKQPEKAQAALDAVVNEVTAARKIYRAEVDDYISHRQNEFGRLGPEVERIWPKKVDK